VDTRPERIILLKVPIDIVPPDELPEVIRGLLSMKRSVDSPEGGMDIVLLSLWDLLRARRNNEYRNYVLNAALIIPISRSLVSGAKFLTKKKIFRHMPFKFVISLLTIMEKQEQSVYLLGGGSRILKKTEKNIRLTYPQLKIVGRFELPLRKKEEGAVIEAIRKSSPTLLLAGKGIRNKELWIYRNSSRLNSGFRLWCSDLFNVFAEKKSRPSEIAFEKGLECIGYCLRNPLKIFRIFPYFRYKLLLLFYKLFRKY